MGQLLQENVMRRIALGLCALLLIAPPALANDGFGGLSATGLTFGQTDAVAMVEEDLYISLEKITVDYLFRNTSGSDVTGEVIFPLPPISVYSTYDSMMNLPEDLTREDLLNFTATVDGQPVTVTIDRIAVLEAPWEEGRKPSEQYDTPGQDVTALLAKLGIPLTLEVEPVREALLVLTPEEQAMAKAAGIADFYDGDAATGDPRDAFSMWSIVWRYHWTQTFPAGKDLRISHSYDNRPPGGLFYWTHPAEEYQDDFIAQYCIDEGTSKAMEKALKTSGNADSGNYGVAYNLSYVLRTANSWNGPIGKFRLTLDKGDPGNVISLCADGVKKTGPTTFVIEKTDFVPDSDLDILLVQPVPAQ
jgi:Domain of unknown function (DUF4424)